MINKLIDDSLNNYWKHLIKERMKHNRKSYRFGVRSQYSSFLPSDCMGMNHFTSPNFIFFTYKKNKNILWSPRYLTVIRLCDHMPRNFWKTCLNGVGGWTDDLRGLLQLKDAVSHSRTHLVSKIILGRLIFQSLLGGGEVL